MKAGSCLDQPRKMIIGETFQQHCKMYVNPHLLEGRMYTYADDLIMVAQVGYEEFVLVSLLSGNRYSDHTVTVESDTSDGIPLDEVLPRLAGDVGDCLAHYVGTIDDVVRTSILQTIGRS